MDNDRAASRRASLFIRPTLRKHGFGLSLQLIMNNRFEFYDKLDKRTEGSGMNSSSSVHVINRT